MLRNMPRHMFGNVQSKLFPWYFATGIVANLIMMYSFYVLHPNAFTFDFSHMWNNEHGFQVLKYFVFLDFRWQILYVGLYFGDNLDLQFGEHILLRTQNIFSHV